MDNNFGYFDEVMDHFTNPRNVMKLKEVEYKADSAGMAGNPACGDMMKVWIKVDNESEKISDLKWKTFGCAGAIGSTSMMSEMATENGGLTLDKALALTPQQIMGGLPNINSEGETLWKVFPLPMVASLPASPFHGASARCMKHTRLGGITPRGKPRGIIKIKIHCSVLGDKALRAAIENYFETTGQAARVVTETVTKICDCLNVTDREIEEQVLEGADSFEKLQERTKISTGCGSCRPAAEALFADYRQKYFG